MQDNREGRESRMSHATREKTYSITVPRTCRSFLQCGTLTNCRSRIPLVGPRLGPCGNGELTQAFKDIDEQPMGYLHMGLKSRLTRNWFNLSVEITDELVPVFQLQDWRCDHFVAQRRKFVEVRQRHIT